MLLWLWFLLEVLFGICATVFALLSLPDWAAYSAAGAIYAYLQQWRAPG